MILAGNFITLFSRSFACQNDLFPWEITGNLNQVLLDLITKLDDNYMIENGIAIHKTAVIDEKAILKAPVIISAHCFVGSNACLRNGIYLGEHVKIGTGCEIKTSIIFDRSAIAHFNFIGDSIIGSDVNFEAGSITANHYNEREDKRISVFFNSAIIPTNVDKFGSLVGDGSKIGANAVLSPGTILPSGTIVKRLELIDQMAHNNNKKD